MKIKVHDDKKEKSFSWDASFDLTINTVFGANEEEVVAGLKEEIEKAIDILKNIDYSDIEYIDGLGRKIEKR